MTEAKPNPEPAFLTLKDLTARWKISERKIRRLIAAKELAAHRFGSQWRVSVADMTAFERLHRLG